jgi:hypothetical protein
MPSPAIRACLQLSASALLWWAPPSRVVAADPCALTLVEPVGGEAVDRELARLQQQVRAAADPLPWLERLGWCFVAKARASSDPGFHMLAEQCALCIESKRPGALEALALRAHVLVNQHRFAGAEALARDLVARRGIWLDHAVLSDALEAQGKVSAAVASCQRALDLRPGPATFARAAHLRWLRGDVAGARDLIATAAKAAGSRGGEAGAWMHCRLGAYELQLGNPGPALAALETALALEPGYAPALHARGRLRLALAPEASGLRGAVADLTLAARQSPLPEFQWSLAEALRASGSQVEAAAVELQLLGRGEAEDPRTLSLHLATSGRDAGRAVRLAEAELEVRGDVLTLDALAWAKLAAGGIEEARRLSLAALAEGTRDARLLLHAGAIALAAGCVGDARRWLEDAESQSLALLPSERRRLSRELAALGQERLSARDEGKSP